MLLKRVLRYVKGTIGYVLRIRKLIASNIHAFSDSNWASCPIGRKSTSGFAVFVVDNLVSWVCHKQRIVAHSSTEVEFKTLADVSIKVTWVVSFFA